MAYKCSRGDLFRILQEHVGGRGAQKLHLLNYLISETGIEELPDQIKILQRDVTRFCSKVYAKLDECSRRVDLFLSKNEEWLRNEFVSDISVQVPMPSTSGRGRPHAAFVESSERSKRRKTEQLRKSGETAESLAYAARIKYQEGGETDKSKLLCEMEKSPRRASKIRSGWKFASTFVKPKHSVEEALALFLEADFTKHQYLVIRQSSKTIGADIYPSYHDILKAKKNCYPDGITVSETCVEVKLQELLNHTVTRILQAQKPVLETITLQEDTIMTLVSKWGCDGSSGQSQYKQIAQDENFSDANLFFTSIVPLQMYYLNKDSKKVIVWQNPKPSSTRFCRPIQLQFQTESSELARNVIEHVEAQIENLEYTIFKENNKKVTVKHNLSLTMVDGKICNAVTKTGSTQTCYICGATPKMMNDIPKVRTKESDPSTFRFGLSTLHSWIRFFECLLHISYRLDVKTWQVRGDDKKKLVQARKARIQNKFKSEMGLIVDQPKVGGSGTSNDGNTARRFFENVKLSFEITGINEEFIYKFKIVLITLSCGFSINTIKFGEYALETAELYIKLYPWYYMPQSVHKILLHGPAVISAAMLPIGMMSEEAQESRNKHLKAYREHHARKVSRTATNQDVFYRLLETSDPYISTLRQKYIDKTKRKVLPEDVISLLSIEEETVDEEDPNTASDIESD